MIEFVTLVKKYGSYGLMAVMLYWMNQRLEIQDAKIANLEQKLFDCYDDKFQLKHGFNHNVKEPQRYYAIIPNNKKYIKTKRHLGA
jgi:ribosomal protein L16 Arg81 hydroxylase